ncbi:RES domain-containing protein [Cryobacterium glaciale]|uniref:RES domain-containing protein n=1 Tax=Cryobacterium glaciale TaxID=1259145 RepID=A0A4R8UNT5_9MICO|nr:RES domain-containing protein [Cryobacterium glaciale]
MRCRRIVEITPDATNRLAVRTDPGEVWRIGYGPEPWNWVDWAHAVNGRFNGRWDALDSAYRTIYAGSTLFACLVEVLARFRLDPLFQADMVGIDVDEADAALYSTVPIGIVDEAWLKVRSASRANLSGGVLRRRGFRNDRSASSRVRRACRWVGIG